MMFFVFVKDGKLRWCCCLCLVVKNEVVMCLGLRVVVVVVVFRILKGQKGCF